MKNIFKFGAVLLLVAVLAITTFAVIDSSIQQVAGDEDIPGTILRVKGV